VRFSIERPFRTFQYYHCSRCRKATGSAHAANLFLPASQFAWTAGEELTRRYEHAPARAFCTGYCSRCGGNLPWVTRNGKMVIVPAGALDADPGERPTRSVYFASRAPWYVHCSDLPAPDEEPLR